MNDNLMLSKSATYRHAFCTKCKRQYPTVILNIEGYVHHGSKIVCVDTKACNRYVRKQRRK